LIVNTHAHVGDTRAYLLRAGQLSQLTEDQTIVHQWEKEGKLEPGEAARHPHRHILLQAVGSGSDLEVDITHVKMRERDRVVLSSDGMHGMVDDDALQEVLSGHPEPDQACRVLIDRANEAGGDDNITVLILDAGVPESADTDDIDDAPVIVSKPASKKRKRRARPVKGLLVALVVITFAAGLVYLVLVRTGDPQYVVATSGDTVAVLKGSPARDGGEARGEVVRVYRDEPLDHFPRPVQRELRSGIRVSSLEEAERVIATLPRVLGPASTPTPLPEPDEPDEPAEPADEEQQP
jgi:hypothetical protein